jgi:uncharacterized protein (DUF305 family)
LNLRRLSYGIGVAFALAIGISAGAQYRELQHARAQLKVLQPSEIDIGFSQSMSFHHRQAIAIAQLLLDGRPTGLAPLAQSIASSQMQGWLRLWNQTLLPPTQEMTWMLLGNEPLDEQLNQYLIACGQSAAGMPGIASSEELMQLRRLDGRARDALFLRLMLNHHQGGIPMAQFAASQAKLAVVRKIAAQMTLDQSQEIHQIQTLLAAISAPAGD